MRNRLISDFYVTDSKQTMYNSSAWSFRIDKFDGADCDMNFLFPQGGDHADNDGPIESLFGRSQS